MPIFSFFAPTYFYFTLHLLCPGSRGPQCGPASQRQSAKGYSLFLGNGKPPTSPTAVEESGSFHFPSGLLSARVEWRRMGHHHHQQLQQDNPRNARQGKGRKFGRVSNLWSVKIYLFFMRWTTILCVCLCEFGAMRCATRQTNSGAKETENEEVTQRFPSMGAYLPLELLGLLLLTGRPVPGAVGAATVLSYSGS